MWTEVEGRCPSAPDNQVVLLVITDFLGTDFTMSGSSIFNESKSRSKFYVLIMSVKRKSWQVRTIKWYWVSVLHWGSADPGYKEINYIYTAQPFSLILMVCNLLLFVHSLIAHSVHL